MSRMFSGIVSKDVPARAVKDHDDPIPRMPGCHFVQEYLHAVAVDMRKDQAVECSVSDGNSAIGIRILLGHHGVAQRANGFRTPAPSGVRDTAKTGLILEHYPDRSFPRPCLVDLRDEPGEFFFHASWASLSAFGCRVSGASFLQPWRWRRL